VKRAVAIVGGLAVIAALIGAGWIVNVYRTHPRNESGYIAYLQTYGIDNTPTAHLPARALLITEGDRACDWLGGTTVSLVPWTMKVGALCGVTAKRGEASR
jgi:hypothetical protein